MTLHAVISAVRIHDWLTRTPELRFVRGASAMLREETRPENLALPDGVSWCDDVGTVSGVLAVTIADPNQAEEQVTRLAASLRKALPDVEFDAWWTDERDYVSAFSRASQDALRGGSDPEVGRKVFLPPLFDVPIVQPCGACRREAVDAAQTALPPRNAGDPSIRLGRDCRSRHTWSGRDAPPPGVAGRLAHDFEELAAAGGVDPSGERRDNPIRRAKTDNHLATISADGNGLGGLMRVLAATNEGLSADFTDALRAIRSRIAGHFDEVTNDAVRRAAKSVSLPGQTVAPSICHLVGGDDVLVSVPAPLAWRFVDTLLGEFDAGVDRTIRSSVDALTKAAFTDPDRDAASRISAALDRVSLGAGIAFAHASHPFADTDRLAASALRQAKNISKGETSGVSWIDVTEDAELTAGRYLDGLRLAAELGDPNQTPSAFRLTRSAQAALSGLLVDEWGGRPDEVTVKAAGQAIRRWAKRTGVNGLPGTLDADATATPKVTDLRILRDQLSRARWWPAAPGPVDAGEQP